MDLDNIKKTWQETNIKPGIDDEKIRKMLSNEGHSAFNSLLRYEKLGIAVLVICLPLGYLLFSKYTPLALCFIGSNLLALLWQIYKLRKLKQVDMVTMSITEVSCHIYWYRKIIIREFFVGAIWLICFFIFFGYYELIYDSASFTRQLIVIAAVIVIGLAVAYIIYKILYLNNIKKLETAIKEIEDFEKDNKE